MPVIRVQLNIRNRNSNIRVKEILVLYQDLFNQPFTVIDSPENVDLMIADCIMKYHDPCKTILIGFDVPSYHCIQSCHHKEQILKAIRKIINRPKYEPQEITLGKRRVVRIDVGMICVIETRGRRLSIKTATDEYLDTNTISYWQDYLEAWPFLEIYRGILVNLCQVVTVNKDHVILKNGLKLPVARRRYQEILTKMRYLTNE